jgi:ssDNA-binding Zn-finger/Zn-ribbon topoisomerase 1
VVDCRRDIHEKVVLIDSDIVWSGSLNPLSHTWRTDEVMNRLKSPSYAETVAAFLSKRPWISPTTAATSVASAENPRCPLCGGRTYYADGPHGPYFSCEEEDDCGWRESVRKTARSTNFAASDHPAQGPPCPKCGKETRLRQGRHGPFYSCAGYPKCGGTINIAAVSAQKGQRNRPSKRNLPEE